MKVKQKIFPFCKKREAKLILKAVWLAFFLLAPLLYVSAHTNIAKGRDNGISSSSTQVSQETRTLTGVVVDEDGNGMPGVTIYIKGTTKGVTSGIDGEYSILVEEEDVLVFSFIGMTPQEISVKGKSNLTVTLKSENQLLEDVVVVGYGIQTKESVVGAITKTTGEELGKSGGVTNVAEALQGRLPGVTTMISSELPGENNTKIVIRGQSSWNGGGQPLILVDGIERNMNDIDFEEIDQVSVLKDASATAVFGVQGANGVILFTTKRGSTGKAKLSLSANVTMKSISKLPEKMDGYNSKLLANEAIIRELAQNESSWGAITPIEIVEKYRNPENQEEAYQFPNIDWEDALLKDFAVDHRVNMSVRGGTDFAKYFGSLSYLSQSDIFDGERYDNNKGYTPTYKYDRFNYRSNLDFNLSKSTELSINLAGFYGIQNKPKGDLRLVISSIYALAPTIYTPIFPDGYYGRDIGAEWGFTNPLVALNNSGNKKVNTFQVNGDIKLRQKLDFITKGLSVDAKLSLDNTMISVQQLNDPANNVIYRIYDKKGNEIIESPEGINDFDFVVQPWTLGSTNIEAKNRKRILNYQLALRYHRIFDKKHNVSGLFLFKRQEAATGSMLPRYREDWVGRLTYDFNSTYFLDLNGAYNGSEKFGPNYRFDLFPSAAVGWLVSNESFLQKDWLTKLKIRGSYGLVGDDQVGGRWNYSDQWSKGGSAYLNSSNFNARSPYIWYKESVLGNPDLKWETATKSNLGIELSLWKNLITAEFDYFTEDREDILLAGNLRSVPDFYGIKPFDLNTGSVEVKGYEVVLGVDYLFKNSLRLWSNFSLTNAKDVVLYKDDPALRPFYQNSEGYAIGQTRASIPGDIMQNWDDIYMSTPVTSGQAQRRIGYYDLVDFNGDGEFSSTYDNTPYGYPGRPQKSWTLGAGADYKGFSFSVLFYGTQNATKTYVTETFTKQSDIYYAHMMDYWSKENPQNQGTLGGWSENQATTDPRKNLYDASLVRLKTMELAYRIPKAVCEKLGVAAVRVFVNGNNLYLWTDLPDDREYNGNNVVGTQVRGDYPTTRKFNFGLNVNF